MTKGMPAEPVDYDVAEARSLLDQLLTDSRMYTQSSDYKELLDFVVRLRNFAPFNAMLLQLQKPGLRYAASANADMRSRLSETLKQMKDGEADLVERASKLWRSKLCSVEELEKLASEVSIVTKARKDASTTWIDALENEASGVATMSAVDANRLHGRATDPPPVLNESHTERLSKIVRDIERRLEGLKLDWLVERFTELPQEAQKKFLQIASEVASGCAKLSKKSV